MNQFQAMRQYLTRRCVSAWLCGVLLCAMLCPIFYIAAEVNHHCTREADCPVCLVLTAVAVLLMVLAETVMLRATGFFTGTTLVMQKIRLNN